MDKLLIINKFQFGYHVDVYKWCQYLKDEYLIKVITFDEGRPRVKMEGIITKYISSKGSRIKRGISYLFVTLLEIALFKGRIIVCGFPGCHVYKVILPWKKMHLDIRTLTISSDPNERKTSDDQLKKAVSLYDQVSAISEGVAKELSITKPIQILPLGAEVVSNVPKSYDNLKLLYIGTFSYRHVDVTIRAFKKALEILGPQAQIHYDIIGDGVNGELEEYRKLVNDLNMKSYIDLHGYVHHDKLDDYLNKCNIGVSYIPMTSYYDFQPPTKTFEYAMSGLYVIATGTISNKEIIGPSNGIVVDDGVDAFTNAIVTVYNHRFSIREKDVRDSLKDYEWATIVNNILKPMLVSLK